MLPDVVISGLFSLLGAVIGAGTSIFILSRTMKKNLQHEIRKIELQTKAELSVRLLDKGNRSTDMCYSLYQKFWDFSVKAKVVLEDWHDKQVTALKIDLDKNRRSKSGVEGFFAHVPAFFDDKYKYKDLKQGIAQKINDQSQTKPQQMIEQKAVYDEDVQIVIKDGKYYYQHDAPAAANE